MGIKQCYLYIVVRPRSWPGRDSNMGTVPYIINFQNRLQGWFDQGLTVHVFSYNHKQDRAYTFPELADFVEKAGLNIVDISLYQQR